MTTGPMVMLSTNCPSITSRCRRSAPAASTAATSASMRLQSAARSDGATAGVSVGCGRHEVNRFSPQAECTGRREVLQHRTRRRPGLAAIGDAADAETLGFDLLARFLQGTTAEIRDEERLRMAAGGDDEIHLPTARQRLAGAGAHRLHHLALGVGVLAGVDLGDAPDAEM